MVSKIELWNFFNSSISLRLLSWASRRSQFCFNDCSWRNWRSCRSRSSVSLGTMKFFLLRLDRFTSFVCTSSVLISLEFVCSNLRLTISEDLLPLSVQESPDLFAFIILSLNFLTLLVTYVTTNNKFHRSIMTHWRRRQTGRQTFFFRVIDSSLVRVEQRLTDNGVVVVQAFGNRCSVTDSFLFSTQVSVKK